MELLIALGVLYGLQCFVWLPEGATLFVRPLGAWVIANGPGWRLPHLLPSAASLLAARLPFLEQEGRLYGRAGPTWLSSRGWGERGAPAEPAALAEAEAHGSVVRVAGRPFARALAREEAEPLASFLRDVAQADAPGAAALIAGALADSLSLARYRENVERLAEATRWLRWSSDLYWTGLYIGLPIAMLVWGGERALLLSLPLLGPLHLVTLVAYRWAYRRLHPEKRGELFESTLAVSFYPPLLLRAYHDLRTRALASFHPAVVAVAALPHDAGRTFLRTEILRLRVPGDAQVDPDTAPPLGELERRALWNLAADLGESPETLLAAPARHDPRAETYCPACHSEYALAAGTCTDCDTELTPYAAE